MINFAVKSLLQLLKDHILYFYFNTLINKSLFRKWEKY